MVGLALYRQSVYEVSVWRSTTTLSVPQPTYFEMYVSGIINGYALPSVYISLKLSCHDKAVDFIRENFVNAGPQSHKTIDCR